MSPIERQLACYIQSQKETDRKSFFELMYHTFFDKVFGIAKARFLPYAEDIASDVFLSLMKKDPSYFLDFNLEGCIVITTVRKCNDYYRKKGMKPHLDLLVGYAYTDMNCDPTLDAELQMDCSYALSRIPDRQQKVIQLQQQGYNYEEIAALLDISKAAVRNLIFRAKKQLAKQFVIEDFF